MSKWTATKETFDLVSKALSAMAPAGSSLSIQAMAAPTSTPVAPQ